ncbi:uncharacterized protein [Rutidosis leptorrhynchoides]|uniref:uncharacterized protein n=1 Tax=Rutidosis leptorrhynchoides TaxID=125765 RepID=UPI003A98EDBA
MVGVTLHPVPGFIGETNWPLDRVTLDATLDEGNKQRTIPLTFVVVKNTSKYNIILGCVALQNFGGIASTVHGMVKFSTSSGVAMSFSDRVQECAHESDMTGVSRDIVEHKLNTNPGLTPIRQKKRGIAPERNTFLRNEVDKHVHAGILREVKYQTCVANPILVKKADGSWGMCVEP